MLRSALPWETEWPRTDFSRATVKLEEIRSGGPPKDGIPALDAPRFVSIQGADDWLDPREPVIVVQGQSRARAYPLQILIYHEIVNDTFEGLPISVTFCPLCNASIVFDRRVDDQVLDFGTTGKLRKSDLVMYDRQTESWWQQFTGTGIVGQYAGTELRQVPSQIVAYEDFKAAYPSGEVLSRSTGYWRSYGRNPYRGYDRVGDKPFLYFDRLDGRLPLVIFYERSTLSALDRSRITDSKLVHAATGFDRRLGDRIMRFERIDGDFVDRETGSRWNALGQAITGPLKGQRLRAVDSGVHFAFAWLAFRPDSDIYIPSPSLPHEGGR
jgi:hypothetical protein